MERAKRPERLPVVFTREGVRAVLAHLRGDAWLLASPLHGSGLRLMECVRLRVKDLGLERRELTVRDGKGGKDRVGSVAKIIFQRRESQATLTQAAI